MNKKEKKIVLKKILHDLGNDGLFFEIKNDIAFVKSIGNCYRGIFIDSSQINKDDFYIEIFFVPLYIPTDFIYFNNGWRLSKEGCSDTLWTKESTGEIAMCIKQVALKKLLHSSTDLSLLNTINEIKLNKNNIVTLETKFILAARMGDIISLQKAYKDIKLQINENNFSWQKKITERIEIIIQNFKDVQFITDITNKWRNETVKKLNLQSWAT